MAEPGLGQALEQGIDSLGLHPAPGVVDQLLAYLDLLVQWNKAYNLTAVREPAEMVQRHLLDSLTLVPYIESHDGQRYIDVGTGAGLPGIPLAIWFPQRQFHLLDSAGKKMRFLFKVRHSLQLSNVELHDMRVEAFADEQGFDAVLTRAYASLADMVSSTAHLLRSGGEFIAMKAELGDEERNALPSAYTIAASMPLCVPGAEARRELIIIRPA